MKRLTVLCLCFCLFGCNSNVKEDYTDWKQRNLQGTVKSLIETTSVAVERFGEVVPEKQIGQVQRNFDKDGMLILDGNKSRKIVRDESGKIINLITYANDTIEEQRTFEYEDGKLVRESNSDIHGVFGFMYRYDGEFICEIDVYRDGKFLTKTKMEKGNNGRFVFKTYDSEGELEEHGESILKNDILQKETRYNKDGEFIHEFEFDKYGNWLSTKKFDKSVYAEKWVYEYDSQGNWTKRVYYSFDKPDEITIREIEYY